MAARRSLEWIGMFEGLAVFCLSKYWSAVVRHSAGGVVLSMRPCICMWYVPFAMCMCCSKSDRLCRNLTQWWNSEPFCLPVVRHCLLIAVVMSHTWRCTHWATTMMRSNAIACVNERVAKRLYVWKLQIQPDWSLQEACPSNPNTWDESLG